MDQGHAWMNPVVLDFPVREGVNVLGEYEQFIINLRETLAAHPLREDYVRQYGEWLWRHPLLPKQQAPQPARWVHINLILENEDGVEQKRTTIAVRDDNVYLLGFKNQDGKWYELGMDGKNARLIPGSTFLGCDTNYQKLIDGGADNLVSLSLTKYDVIHAIKSLSMYQQTGPGGNGETRRHLARLCVIICECARMLPHRGTVSTRWNQDPNGVGLLVGINLLQAENVKNWSKMSKALLADPNPLDNSYIDVVHLLHNTADASRSQQQPRRRQTAGGGGSSHQGQGSSETQGQSSSRPASGGDGTQEQQGQTGGKVVRSRPLLEVFSVTVEEGYAGSIGTIAVFDGKRGQIIYNGGGQDYPDGNGGLQLIGPYKAISAEGSFAIQVYGITSGSGTDTSDESGKVVMGEMLWDGYTDNVKYDELLTGHIISTGTGQHTIATVAYAVWSDAVEATVEVNLLLPRITRVDGTITAHYGSSYANTLVLFTRESGEGELVPSAADSMVPLELPRSVIAVPVLSRYSRVKIFVQLLVWTAYNDDFLRGSIHFYFDKQTGEMRMEVEQRGDFFLPMVGSTGTSDAIGGGAISSASRQGAEQTIQQRVKVQVNMTSPGFHLSPLKPDSDWRSGKMDMA